MGVLMKIPTRYRVCFSVIVYSSLKVLESMIENGEFQPYIQSTFGIYAIQVVAVAVGYIWVADGLDRLRVKD